MKITHIMSDGTARESIEGIKIPNKEFYIVFNELRSRKNEKKKDKVQVG